MALSFEARAASRLLDLAADTKPIVGVHDGLGDKTDSRSASWTLHKTAPATTVLCHARRPATTRLSEGAALPVDAHPRLVLERLMRPFVVVEPEPRREPGPAACWRRSAPPFAA